MYPKISIITPSHNQGQFLEQTILSIINQNYPNLEYIVVDGGSTDKSVDIIKKYEEHLAYWVSEKDRGQTHAINKGLIYASGEIINWLNSDDLMSPGALHLIAEEFNKNPEADFYFGDFSMIDYHGRVLFARKSPPYNFHALFYGRQLSAKPSVFFNRGLLEKLGDLDESLSFCMDLEFWIRSADKGMKFRQIKEILTMARIHMDAKTVQHPKMLHEEHKAIVRKYSHWKLCEGSMLEDIYYTILNRWWRFIAALNRAIFRRDWTFGRVQRTQKSIRRSCELPL